MYEKITGDSNDRFKIVENCIELNPEEDVLLITGPNNGGKTVLLESLAVSQLLFQNGMVIPASEGEMPIYKKIFTHFPKDEDISKGAGRLGEEAIRVSNILKKSGEGTLVIFNEPYIATSPTEGLDILVQSIERFRENRIVTYLVTHYLDILNEIDDSSGIASYVLEIINGERTYKANRKPPLTESHAQDVAVAHGVDFDGIMRLINSRRAEGKKEEQDNEITI